MKVMVKAEGPKLPSFEEIPVGALFFVDGSDVPYIKLNDTADINCHSIDGKGNPGSCYARWSVHVVKEVTFTV